MHLIQTDFSMMWHKEQRMTAWPSATNTACSHATTSLLHKVLSHLSGKYACIHTSYLTHYARLDVENCTVIMITVINDRFSDEVWRGITNHKVSRADHMSVFTQTWVIFFPACSALRVHLCSWWERNAQQASRIIIGMQVLQLAQVWLSSRCVPC